jgi:hypothetical protein
MCALLQWTVLLPSLICSVRAYNALLSMRIQRILSVCAYNALLSMHMHMMAEYRIFFNISFSYYFVSLENFEKKVLNLLKFRQIWHEKVVVMS